MDSNDLVTCSKTLMQALNEIDQVETHSLPAKFVSSSITDMLLVEQAAAILVPHGISMEVEGAFGAPSSPERFPSILHSYVGILYIVDERRLLELRSHPSSSSIRPEILEREAHMALTDSHCSVLAESKFG